MRWLILWSISTGVLVWCVLPYFFKILSQSWYIECRIINFLFLLSVNPFFKSKYCLVALHYFFTDTWFDIFRLRDLFYYWWKWVVPLFSQNGIITVLQVYVNAMLAQYVFLIPCCYGDQLPISNHVGKAECSNTIPGHGRGVNAARQYWLGWIVVITASRSRVAAGKKSIFFFALLL